jgi:hypothetical protein
MPTQEDIEQQETLLRTHRKTLGMYLVQLAKLGGLNARPEVLHGIDEAREGIRQCKKTLRDWGVTVNDEPNDEPALNKSSTRILGAIVGVTGLVGLLFFIFLQSNGTPSSSSPTAGVLVTAATIQQATGSDPTKILPGDSVIPSPEPIATAPATVTAKPTSPPTATAQPTNTPTPTNIPATNTPEPAPTDTPANTILDVGTPWRQEGVELTLISREFDTRARAIFLEWRLKNDTGQTILVSFSAGNFDAQDNNKNPMRVVGFFRNSTACAASVTLQLESGQSIRNQDCDRPLRIEFDYANTSITEVIVTARDVSRIKQAQWRVPINLR